MLVRVDAVGGKALQRSESTLSEGIGHHVELLGMRRRAELAELRRDALHHGLRGLLRGAAAFERFVLELEDVAVADARDLPVVGHQGGRRGAVDVVAHGLDAALRLL